ncbi:UDP-N-acetylenolpyruvoylglucosamine reductase [Alphaproteobacteria bacterium]|nr:UDP-N-acetylenolpyruvoylglucosamine reductase [Alphaproteobacteria bacterium]
MAVKCLENYEIKPNTTFKIGGRARRAFFPETVAELVEVLAYLPAPVIIGGGSNLLVATGGLDADVVMTAGVRSFRAEENGRIFSDCGVMLPRVSQAAQRAGLSGFEFMSGIPGTVGGAVGQNAGAFGQDIAEVMAGADLYDLKNRRAVKVPAADMGFSRRRCAMLDAGGHVLLAAEFKLGHSSPDAVAAKMRENKEKRLATQPGPGFLSAGCVFRNPEGDYPAGMLLDQAGAKGLRCGGASVYHDHANFIISDGSATSADVRALMAKMAALVKAKFNIDLEPEIRVFGGG